MKSYMLRASMMLSGCLWLSACAAEIADESAVSEELGKSLYDVAPPRTGAITSIVAGARHTCVSLYDGRVKCWGDGAEGSLGTPPEEDALLPVQAPVRGVRKIQGGSSSESTFAFTRGGLVSWGFDFPDSLGHRHSSGPAPSAVWNVGDVVEISASLSYTCGRRADDTVVCFGDERRDARDVFSFPGIRQIALGGGYGAGYQAGRRCALLDTGRVECWGDNNGGMLGVGFAPPYEVTEPTEVVGITDAVEIALGHLYTCARLATGRVACWGVERSGTVFTSVPREIPGVEDATQVVVGDGHACARQGNGTTVCWGSNRYGQLGDGSTTNERMDAGGPVRGLTGEYTLAAGGLHTCAIVKQGNHVICWGLNNEGQLGDGTRTNRPTPVLVRDLL